MTADQLAECLGVVKTTMANKAALINKTLNLSVFEPGLTHSTILQQLPLAWLVELDGLIVDARMLPAELQDEARRRGLIPDLDSHRAAMTKTTRLSELDALIEELTVDAYGDDEQLSGFHCGAEEAFEDGECAQLVGVQVQLIAVDQGPDARTALPPASNATMRSTRSRLPTSRSLRAAGSGSSLRHIGAGRGARCNGISAASTSDSRDHYGGQRGATTESPSSETACCIRKS